jgi:hypothetical protein
MALTASVDTAPMAPSDSGTAVRFQLLVLALHTHLLYWSAALPAMLDEDAAMLAFMFC